MLKVIEYKEKLLKDKNCIDSSFSIMFLRIGSSVGMNGPVIFMEKGASVHPRLRGTNLVTKYIFLEGFCVIPKKSA